jgi:hypothetical protein
LLNYRRILPPVAALVAVLLASGPASAEGETRVHQADGSVQIYDHVHIELEGQTLKLHSQDHRGIFEITSGACSYAGGLQRCLPYATTLRQHGEIRHIELEHGTVYLNLGDTPARLSHSSDIVAPHGVVVLLRTIRGTFVSVKGTLDSIR